MAESAEGGSGTVVSTELSDPIRSHQDIDQDAVPFYHKAVKFCDGLAIMLLYRLMYGLIRFIRALVQVMIAVTVVRRFVRQDGIAKTFHDIKIFFQVEHIVLLVARFIIVNFWSIFVRAIWRYLLSFQFMRLLYLQLHLPWTFEFRLPLIFGFQRPWTIPAFGIDFLDEIFTNDPAGAPPTWVFDTVVIFGTGIVLCIAAVEVLGHIFDLYAPREAGKEFKFPIVQDQLENSGGSRSWMQEEFVALEEIAIWERPLDRVRSFYPGFKRKGSGVFKHDYIVIKLACGEFFTIEKVADAGKYVKFTRRNGTQRGDTRRFSMELEGATVKVAQLGRVLGAEGHGYDFREKNCLSYAFNTSKRVIKLCGEDPDLETEKQESLLKDLDRLEKAKRTHPVTLVDTALFALFVLFIAVNIRFIGVTNNPGWLRWLRRFLQCDKPYWNPRAKLT